MKKWRNRENKLNLRESEEKQSMTKLSMILLAIMPVGGVLYPTRPDFRL